MKGPILALVVCSAVVPGFGGIIVDSVNAAGPQGLGSGFQFVAPDVGWYFTPSSSYILNSVYFDSGTTDGRTVTEEIFDTTTLALGGTLLRSASFVPGSNGFAGGTFAPLAFTAGHTYFIGALNIMGFDGMVSTNPSAVHLPEAFDDGSMMFEAQCPSCPSSTRAILEFVDTSSVPEPASIWLVIAGCAAISLKRPARKRAS